MLTQMELVGSSGGLGMDEDSGPGSSPLDDLPQYPLEQAEFEYFETSLGDGDGYYDVPSTLTVPAPLNTPDYTTGHGDAMIYDPEITTITSHNLKFPQELPNEDELKFSSDIAHYQDIKPEDEELKFPQSIIHYQPMEAGDEDMKLEDDMSSYEEFSGSFCDESLNTSNGQSDDFGLGSLHDTVDSDQNHKLEVATQAGWGQGGSPGSGKGKIGPLQRRALDSIFRVTEKPSRGMALHIASELGLHYLTVKNFFSNGRRRLRRAAAKLSNPERSRRENERRKEKRRLTALASAAALSGADGRGGSLSAGRVVAQNSQPTDSPPQKESPVVSPERKALMEKLADKVQRSVAQRSLAAEFDMVQPNTILTQNHTHKFPSQPTIEFLPPQSDMSASNLLPNTILTPSDHALVNPSPQDFLTTHTSDLPPTSPTLLNSHNDPWNLF